MPRQVPERDKIKDREQEAIDQRNASKETGHDAGGTAWSDPTTGFTAEQVPEKVTRNESLDTDTRGRITSLEETGSGFRSVSQMPSGNFVEEYEDGNQHTNVEGDSTTTIKGKFLLKVNDEQAIEVDGNVRIECTEASSEIKIERSNGEKIQLLNNVMLINAASVVFQGGVVSIDATTPPTANGRGGFCALPNCLFTGAVHRGSVVNSDGS